MGSKLRLGSRTTMDDANRVATIAGARPLTTTVVTGTGTHGLVSAFHTVSGLTAGHILQALTSTTFGFAALPATAVTPGTYGSATQVPVFTVGADGRLTYIENVNVVPGAHDIVSAHTAADLVVGTVLRATSATEFDFGALDLSNEDAIEGALPGGNLANTAVTPGSYGDATHVATFTVDQQGRLTAADEAAITASGSKGLVQFIGNGNPFLSAPGSNAAEFGSTINGSSTPNERQMPLFFDADAIEYWDFLCVLTGYNGGGLTFTLPWLSAAATTGVCRWGMAIRRLNTGHNFTASHTYDFNDVDSTAQDTAGKIATPTITFTDGADMDNWTNGELAMVRLRRNATHVNDTLLGDAVLIGFIGVET